ncbi:MAG: SH3 domain-containing protein, partial [Lachnospiraceae bacterium]|nr:SH3 domain-containing protein [Lachnospiraceae bacterium]
KVTCYGTSGNWTKVKYKGYYRYVYSSYLSKSEPVSIYTRYVTASSLSIRKKASTSSTVVGYYTKGRKVTCYGTSGNWTKVKYKGYYRYVYSSYLSSSKTSSVSSSSSSSKGSKVANYAVQFV